VPPAALPELLSRRPALARRLGALRERSQVRAVLVEVLERQGGEALLDVLDAVLADHAGGRSPEAARVLTALTELLDEPGRADAAARLLELADELDLPAAARFLQSPAPLLLEQVRRSRVLTGADGKPLTLGERKSLARNPGRMQIDRLLADPSPEVVRNLLASPKLTEADVVRIASRRPVQPEVLVEVVRSRRWVQRYRVRLALVSNPYMEPAMAIRLAHQLMVQDRRRIAADPHLHPRLRQFCHGSSAGRRPDEGEGPEPATTAGYDPDVH
jgi:hypothetical protein